MQKRLENALSFMGEGFIDKTRVSKHIMNDLKDWKKTPKTAQNVRDLISDVVVTLMNVAVPEYTYRYFVNTPEYERLHNDLSDEAKHIVHNVFNVSEAQESQHDSDVVTDSGSDSDEDSHSESSYDSDATMTDD